jgi:hypothetical protein
MRGRAPCQAMRWRPLSIGAVQRRTAVVFATRRWWLCGEGGCGWRRRRRRLRRDLVGLVRLGAVSGAPEHCVYGGPNTTRERWVLRVLTACPACLQPWLNQRAVRITAQDQRLREQGTRPITGGAQRRGWQRDAEVPPSPPIADRPELPSKRGSSSVASVPLAPPRHCVAGNPRATPHMDRAFGPGWRVRDGEPSTAPRLWVCDTRESPGSAKGGPVHSLVGGCVALGGD